MAFKIQTPIRSHGILLRNLISQTSSRSSYWQIQSRRLASASLEPTIGNDTDSIPIPEEPSNPYEDDGMKPLNHLVHRMTTESKIKKYPLLPLNVKTKIPTEKLERLNLIEPVTGLSPIFLRDSCPCPRCRDPSSKQKLFQTTDIPANITARSVMSVKNGGIEIHWENDIEGFDADHVSTFSQKWLNHRKDSLSLYKSTYEPTALRCLWDAAEIEKALGVLEYEDYMKDNESLYKALYYLNVYGLLIVKGVPESEKSVENIGNRIGTLRDTFYGRTWDVKSVPKAKNVAYTHQYLGLHMDLLYMANPPGIQLLHCLKNSCQGGTSLFSDAFKAANSLDLEDFKILSSPVYKMPYHYKNDGQHYRFRHKVIEAERATMRGGRGKIRYINYSPPFQEPLELSKTSNPFWLLPFFNALKRFANLVEEPENLFQYRLKEGECVIFNNRRMLHGRTAFDAEGGERWLKGAYVDSDVFDSRWRVLHEKYSKSARRVIGPSIGPWIRKVEVDSENHSADIS